MLRACWCPELSLAVKCDRGRTCWDGAEGRRRRVASRWVTCDLVYAEGWCGHKMGGRSEGWMLKGVS
ncbi:MAG: hypothetical protein ACKESB_01075 [Candidatus Hodgkinia cicadicola]